MPTLAEILAEAKAKKAAAATAQPQQNPLAAALAAANAKPAVQSGTSGPSGTGATTKSSVEPPQREPEELEAISAEEFAATADVVAAELEGDDETDDETDVGASEFTHASQPDKFDTAEYRQYKEYFEVVKASFQYPEQLASAMQMVMEHIQAHPFLADILHPEDIGTMVSALRESYGVAITRKSTRREKKAVVKADVSEAMNLLSSVSFNL